ncbi:germ cell-specific gene 1-like protein [Oncorhynchus tshawytscha]|uniref:Germ cell-specific gene 1-like protein n=2 Tax=Oncorhynchus TaxID=8016 RepID=A0A8C7N9A0_ONCKI|nr:germ cell-specific gene 1-like protein [Oncorhynchus kisutch]XP_036811578.1 germ cell-specific gene 1-like protein [Oncorhynchus mykiss]XP_042161796.1 germ cell-specific gene 1-like protein [Oncorhynchus tshawytscha]XP_046211189.1 germ cell-specific gene 1-like protein [Oncorhynchus gorbuscha]XP_052334099.1 germ cell-specific gene 1-like protein [Oncorhynchus keta]
MGGMDRQRRVSLALTLNFLALILAVSALTTSYWCEGTRKVAKPFCTGPVTTKQSFCIRFNSSNINDSRLVQYIWESGEDKYIMRKFHTGIWFSCEENVNMTGEICRSFIYVTPSHERGVLWLCIVSECLYILLLATGGILMSIEACHLGNVIDGLKLNAFAAIFTVLSGLLGMVAHMMFTTAFQLTVSVGPEDWKPQTWDYSWSYILAWSSFTACMASSVTIINRYTKTILEFKHKRRNIEKNLKIKQKLLELDSGPGVGVGHVGHVEQVWDMYISSVPSSGCTAEELLDLSSNGRKLSNASVFLDLNDLPDPQREEYC